MEKIVGALKLIFFEQHEIVYNFMMIIMAVIVFMLVNWLKKAYKIIDTGAFPPADKKYVKDINEAKSLGANLQRKIEELSVKVNGWDTQINTVQKGLDEMKETFEKVTSEKSVVPDDIVAKMQSEHRDLFSNLNKRVEDLYDKTRRFQETMMSNQKQFETLKSSLQEMGENPGNTKMPDFDKFTHCLDETSRNIAKISSEVEHLHNKMIEHEDQINDLKHIFEDMDATFAEMNKRFQKLEMK